MGFLQDIRLLAQFAQGMSEYYREPVRPSACFAALRRQVERRESTFLTMLDRAVLDNPTSPYRRLFEWAGVERGDLHKLVRSDGIESCLKILHRAGVYLSIEEFKGRRSIRRSGLDLSVNPRDFDSPVLKRHIEAQTGGSGGVPRLLVLDLEQIADDALSYGAFLSMFGLTDRPSAIWRPVLPGAAGPRKALMLTGLGSPLARWFSQQPNHLDSRHIRPFLMNWFLVVGSRYCGQPIPRPEWTPIEDVERVARWAHESAKSGKPAMIDTMVSGGIRVCMTAAELGLDISGTFFRFGSEPYTETKEKVIMDAGCRATQFYSTTESGHIGIGCGAPATADDVHLTLGKISVIEANRPPGAIEGACFYLTTLKPNTPKIMLNVESGDHGVLEERRCGCAFEQNGHRTHIRNLQSYEKLTAGGMHFLPDDVTDLIEKLLPARFGGGPTDYQIVEDLRGPLSVVGIVASPRVGDVDEDAVREEVIKSLSARSVAGAMMAAQWRQGRVLKVIRREPWITAAGKIPAVHVIRGDSASPR